MRYRRFRKPSKPAVFAMLMAASALALILPRDLLAPARNMTQLIALPQYALTRGTEAVTQPIRNLRDQPVPSAQHTQLLREKEALENENIALWGKITQLQATADELQRIRNQPDFPPQGTLITARCVAWDAVPARDSMALLKSQSKRAEPGDWVTSHLAVQAGSRNGVQDQAAVLARETLIGRIEQSAPFVSRVVLLSDLTNKAMRVHVGSPARDNRKLAFVADLEQPQQFAAFVLQGLGRGRMKLLDVDARYVDQGLIHAGDLVTSDGLDPKLPLRLVVGEITELTRQKSKPLLYDAAVKHRYDPKQLREVFIVNLTR